MKGLCPDCNTMHSGSCPAWLPMNVAPEDESILLATTGGWVFLAWKVTDEDTNEASWSTFPGGQPVHANHTPLGWAPIPTPPQEKVQ